MSDPREWWINPETFIILDYEPKYDDGMFNVIEKSEYDALKAELEQTKDYNKFLSEQLAANASSRSYFENECRKLEHELEAAKGEVANLTYQNKSIEESATIVVRERDELKAELSAAKHRIETWHKPDQLLLEKERDEARAVLGEKK